MASINESETPFSLQNTLYSVCTQGVHLIVMQQKQKHNTWQRHYRTLYTERLGECAFQLLLEESDLHVIAKENLASPMLETLGNLRADIKTWAALYPEFRTSLTPLPIPQKAPQIIQRMYAGALKAQVGPFAAVAGSIAQILAEAYAQLSPDIIVENGGDIYMFSQRPRTVALLADPKGGPSLGLQLEAEDFPLALCASSATIGHSLSLGNGELAVVRAKDGALADAMATALGNHLQGESSVERALDFAQSVAGVEGVFVQCGEAIGVWGNMVLTHVTV